MAMGSNGTATPLLSQHRSGSCTDCSEKMAPCVPEDADIAVSPAHVGSASMSTATSSLCLAVLGAGQLTLPYAFSQLGMVLGLFFLALCSFLSAHSLHTLSINAMHYTPSPKQCIDSYAEMVVRVLGKPGQIICSTLIAVYAWGGALSFMVILKGELLFLLSAYEFSGATSMVFIACTFIWPLSSLDDLSALKRFSPFGCLAALFITLVVLLCTDWTFKFPLGAASCKGPVDSDLVGLYWSSYPESLLAVAAALPLLSFALNMSWAYVPILCTLERRDDSRVTRFIYGATSIIALNYFLLSLYGYSMFCSGVDPNILVSLGAAVSPGSIQSALVFLARFALALQLTLALPMRFFIARRTLRSNAGLGGRVLLSGVMVAMAAGLAAMPLSIAMCLGIVSSICASMIIYILPATIDLKSPVQGRVRKSVSLVSFIFGVVMMVSGLAANILGVSVGS